MAWETKVTIVYVLLGAFKLMSKWSFSDMSDMSVYLRLTSVKVMRRKLDLQVYLQAEENYMQEK